MSTGTRAARAATSRQVKQEIVRLLFSSKYSKTGPEKHRLLDYSIYSYQDLRKAYLEKLQEIHPDKSNTLSTTKKQSNKKNSDRQYFHELQSAWKKYDEIAKAMKTISSSSAASQNATNINFTKFGVGCSFDDNEEERALRNEITDQACKGWLPSGALTAGNNINANTSTTNNNSEYDDDDDDDDKNGIIRKHDSNKVVILLVDDDMFLEEEEKEEEEYTTTRCVSSSDNTIKTSPSSFSSSSKENNNIISTQFKTLIPGMKIIRKR